MTGKVFGTPREVRELADIINDVLQIIESSNEKAANMLAQLSDTARDRSYQTAESVVEEVKTIVTSCEEPAEEVTNLLLEYAEYLESIKDS